ncbi:hypothetical protein QJQ45_010544 [Haematococcus lacustris]|nr:hypothetical protein QJQ45_010544 [Haematococcus lacustris]
MNNPQGRSDAHVSGVPVTTPSAEHEFVPPTTLLDLPSALLDGIALRLNRGRETLARTCFGLFEAGLLHAPSFRLQLDRQCCDQLLSPRVLAALRARTCKLAITLEHPRAQGSRLLVEVLGKLGVCTAVEACKLSSLQDPSLVPTTPLGCSPSLAQCLVDSFPSLTSLALHGYSIACCGLASMLSHPQLSLQLQQLDLSSTTILQAKRPKPGAATLDNLFYGVKLQQLSLSINMAEGVNKPLLPNLQPLSQHLTQLCLQRREGVKWRLDKFTAALQPLAQLQVLTISSLWGLGGLPKLLQALPQLHTLQLPDATVRRQTQLDALLAATQLTSIKLNSLEGLTSSRAGMPCSWQRLELTGIVDCSSVAYYPLHTLTQPLVLGTLSTATAKDDDSCDLVAAAVHNLTQACKVPMRIRVLRLDMFVMSDTPIMAAHQHVKLQQLVAKLQALMHCSWGKVLVINMYMGAADFFTLAPLCRGCTHLEFLCGRLTPCLEFWCQLVHLMPTVTEVVFKHAEGSTSSAMCESLNLMTEQPWAIWLDICITHPSGLPELPACWLASNPSKSGKLKVWFKA